MINHTEASTWSWTENLPTAGDSLSCPWSRKKQTKRSMYFRFFESMGLPWISMRRKKFQKQTTLWPLQRFAIFSYSAINNRSTMKSPDVYLLSEVVDQVLFIRPIRTQQISLAGRPSVHLTQRRGKNKANLLFLLYSYMFDVNSCSFKCDFNRDCFIFSYKASWAIHKRNFTPNSMF